MKIKKPTWDEQYGKEESLRRKNKQSEFSKNTIGRKGVSWEERYGKEKADQMKKNLSKITIKRFTGKKHTKEHKKKLIKFLSQPDEVRWGKEVAERVKRKRSKKLKGKSFIELYGKEKAKYMIRKRQEGFLKKCKGKTYEEIYGVENAKIKKVSLRKTLEEKVGKERADEKKKIKSIKMTKWNNKDIIQKLQNIVKYNGPLSRSEIWNLNKKADFCSSIIIGRNFGSVDNLAELAGIQLKECPRNSGRIGKNETEILDSIEAEKGIKLERSFIVAGKIVDGFDIKNNVAYEVDEPYHMRSINIIKDIIRQRKIEKEIGCTFVRIEDN